MTLRRGEIIAPAERAAQPNRKSNNAMYTSLLFDVEDYTTPARHGLDDIPKWMAEIMTEEKVIGTFLVLGGKARSLAARGRTDVIAAMRRHEIGSHTDNGSHHPTLCEYLAGLDWHKGMSLCREKEGRHIRELESIFRTTVAAVSRHGGNFAAQHVAMAAELGLPHLYSHATPAGGDPAWYCGALNFGRYMGIWEKTYASRRAVDETIARLDAEIRAAAATGCAWRGTFMAHPLMVKCRQFTDAINYADGVNRQPWVLPDFVPERDVRESRNGFRRVVRFLRDHEKLQIRPLSDVARRLGRTRKSISRDELVGYADQFSRSLQIPDRETVSAAELIQAWAEVLGSGRSRIPDTMPLRRLLGPTEELQRYTSQRAFSWPEIQALAARVAEQSRRDGHLPGNVAWDGDDTGRLGLGVLFFMFARAICALAAGKPGRTPSERHAPRYPAIAYDVDADARRGYLGWVIFDENLPMDELCRYARLQTWTCKRTLGS